MKLFAYTIILAALLNACKSKDSIPTPVLLPQTNESDYPIFNIPTHFPKVDFPAENEETKKIVNLGRMLFYDPILSVDSTISCASCHHQDIAFADKDKVSTGFNNLKGDRNSPGLFNMAWQTSFFWDGGATDLESQALGPITSEVEMAHKLVNLNNKLNNNSFYKQKFKEAYNSDSIYTLRIITALAYFQKTFISANSIFDDYLKGNTTVFTNEQAEGFKLFEKHCNTCHSGALLTDYSFQNIGLEAVFKDKGRGKITEKAEDDGKFKVPSLRNVALTAPYMHDGRFSTLDEVLNHYARPKAVSATVSPKVTTIRINETERANLKSFLITLTDYQFIKNKKFKKP